MNIILYLLQIIQYLYQQNCFLIQFICKYIPLKQWAFDDSHSPEYQKFKTDELPKILCVYRRRDLHQSSRYQKFIWSIMDAASRSIIGYHISDNRGGGPCILAMRQAFLYLKELPKNFKFIADGYSAYPLATQQFDLESKGKFKFDISQVIGLTNDDEVSKKHRPYKQMILQLQKTEQLNCS